VSNRQNPASHLPLSIPVHQILLSLTASERHGYAIIQDIRSRTGGEVELTASTLYGALSRMLKDGTIEEVTDRTPEGGDGRRRYYRVTDYGRSVAREEAGRLARVLGQARAQGLGPDTDPAPEGRAR
jgi:DNA-binding PadR family transcriptional regulator